MMMKNLRGHGFDVTGYDARDYVGGLWNYSDDEYLSVQETTVFNSSRYRAAITDFPFTEDVDDYPTWKQLHKYLNDYCDHFDLRSRIRLNTKAVGLGREGTKWGLEVEQKGSAPRVDYFDKVVVATGSFVTPKTPIFERIKLFKGETLHAINYHQPSRFKNKKVLIIGLHATSQDVTKSLSKYTSKVYLSHKNGLVLVSV
jgi:dimethylaniline monooxygenase (N-oxide forming)